MTDFLYRRDNYWDSFCQRTAIVIFCAVFNFAFRPFTQEFFQNENNCFKFLY